MKLLKSMVFGGWTGVAIAVMLGVVYHTGNNIADWIRALDLSAAQLADVKLVSAGAILGIAFGILAWVSGLSSSDLPRPRRKYDSCPCQYCKDKQAANRQSGWHWKWAKFVYGLFTTWQLWCLLFLWSVLR